jgi:hypothetical protein
VVVATTEFESLAREEARAQALPDARIAVVPHPIGGVSDDALRARADAVVDEVMDLFCGRAR